MPLAYRRLVRLTLLLLLNIPFEPLGEFVDGTSHHRCFLLFTLNFSDVVVLHVQHLLLEAFIFGLETILFEGKCLHSFF